MIHGWLPLRPCKHFDWISFFIAVWNICIHELVLQRLCEGRQSGRVTISGRQRAGWMCLICSSKTHLSEWAAATDREKTCVCDGIHLLVVRLWQGGGARGQGDHVRLGCRLRSHPGRRQAGPVCLLPGTRPLLRPPVRVQRWVVQEQSQQKTKNVLLWPRLYLFVKKII